MKINKTPVNRPTGRIPKLTPPAQPGWYKRFRQLAAIAHNHFRIKQ
jgi:hypothetical protein